MKKFDYDEYDDYDDSEPQTLKEKVEFVLTNYYFIIYFPNNKQQIGFSICSVTIHSPSTWGWRLWSFLSRHRAVSRSFKSERIVLRSIRFTEDEL